MSKPKEEKSLWPAVLVFLFVVLFFALGVWNGKPVAPLLGLFAGVWIALIGFGIAYVVYRNQGVDDV